MKRTFGLFEKNCSAQLDILQKIIYTNIMKETKKEFEIDDG